jgi:hypothetical protein
MARAMVGQACEVIIDGCSNSENYSSGFVTDISRASTSSTFGLYNSCRSQISRAVKSQELLWHETVADRSRSGIASSP